MARRFDRVLSGHVQKGASQTCVFRGLKEIAMGVVLLLFTRFDLGMYSFGNLFWALRIRAALSETLGRSYTLDSKP